MHSRCRRLPQPWLGGPPTEKRLSDSNCLDFRGDVEICCWIYHLVSSARQTYVRSAESKENSFRA
jgi:hypothetical protein